MELTRPRLRRGGLWLQCGELGPKRIVKTNNPENWFLGKMLRETCSLEEGPRSIWLRRSKFACPRSLV
jgi:hypothetical protein